MTFGALLQLHFDFHSVPSLVSSASFMPSNIYISYHSLVTILLQYTSLSYILYIYFFYIHIHILIYISIDKKKHFLKICLAPGLLFQMTRFIFFFYIKVALFLNRLPYSQINLLKQQYNSTYI